jgi:hypothetical protein
MNLQSSNELVIGLEHLMGDFPDGGSISMSIFWVLLRRVQKVSHTIYLLELAERNTADHALLLKSALNLLISGVQCYGMQPKFKIGTKLLMPVGKIR